MALSAATLPAPLRLDVARWLNGPPPSEAQLRGRVVLVETFQMLCPGCVSHGLPQAQRVHRTFSREQVVVLGLHTVFEHHGVMGADALAAFLAEYRIDFPVGIDRHDGDPVPVTMGRYRLQGTPSTLLVDRAGLVRESLFGAVDDLVLGTAIGRLLTEPSGVQSAPGPAAEDRGAVCGPGRGCT